MMIFFLIEVIFSLFPSRYLAIDTLLNDRGIHKKFDFPVMNSYERDLMDIALARIAYNVDMAQSWHAAYLNNEINKFAVKKYWFHPKHYHHVESCNINLAS